MNILAKFRESLCYLFNINNSNHVRILTKKHTLFVAHMYQHYLKEIGITSDIVVGRKKKFSKHLYIVICPHVFPTLPKDWIAIQMEQSVTSRYFTNEYVDRLLKARFVLDYNQLNIDVLIKMGVPANKIFLSPVGAFSLVKNKKITKKYDVLFCGDVKNERRQLWLKKISENFNIKIVTSAYAEELYKEISSAKVVLNIHYYEGALLETLRLLESLSLGVHIVSEEGVDQKAYEYFRGGIHFVPIDDIDGMITKIKSLINEEPNLNEINRVLNSSYDLARESFYHALKVNNLFSTEISNQKKLI